jgi:hypothetical protein
VTIQSIEAGQVVDSTVNLVGQSAGFKIELLHISGGEAHQTELLLKSNAAAAW